MCLTCGHNDPASASSSSSDVSFTGCSTCRCERPLSIGPVVTTTLSPDYMNSNTISNTPFDGGDSSTNDKGNKDNTMSSSCAPRNDEQRNRKKQACIFACSDCEMEGAGSNPGASSYSGDFSHFLSDTWTTTTDDDLDLNTPILLSSLFAKNDVNYYFPPRPHSHGHTTISQSGQFPNPKANAFIPRAGGNNDVNALNSIIALSRTPSSDFIFPFLDPIPFMAHKYWSAGNKEIVNTQHGSGRPRRHRRRALSSSSSSSSGNNDDDDASLFKLIFETTTQHKYDNRRMDNNDANVSRTKTPTSSSPPASSNHNHNSHGPINSGNSSGGFPLSHPGSISSPIPISTTSSSRSTSPSTMSYDTTDASTTTSSSVSASSSSISGDNDNDDFAITYCPTPNRGSQCPIMDYFRGEPSSSNARKDSFNAVISQIRQALCELRPLENKMHCKFCKNNMEHFRVFASHVTKDASDKVVCPILMQYVCPLCGARGSNAHTAKYCPWKEFDVVDAMDRMLQE